MNHDFGLRENKPNQTQTNPTCRGVASGEAGSNPISPPSPPNALWEKVEPTRPYVQVAVLMGRLVWTGLFYRPIPFDH